MTTSDAASPVRAETFSAARAVELAQVVRSGFVESRHAGSAIVLNQHAEVVRSIGDPNAPIFPRSTLKPFQAIAMMNSGVGLRSAAAALATASHAGTQRQIQVVRSMIAQAGLTEAALQCPPALPRDNATRTELLRDNVEPAPIYMECSGKHAAMLLACAQNGWPVESYLDPQHPVQQQVRDVIERFCGERPVATGVDGCGAPVFAISLAGLARGYARIRTSSSSSPFALYRNAGILVDAVLADAWGIDGPGRPDTIIADRHGAFAKTGAEGVMVISAPDGTTAAVKVLDGSPRAAALVALTLLADAGALDPTDVAETLTRLPLHLSGGGAVVGDIRVSPLLARP
ncbi:asparaginase [Mycetocola tolaasinivorans]|uniref:Asparaginase n=1 Tax=Mycetocola tolaasinivorans TaxID=76635 RepID=A0A3L7A3X0_9MICO|nr:asparaginase [Mycetocola tolaasinivorans]RLP74814.1 asparaginase [Mycetocola tolaasinivorans]